MPDEPQLFRTAPNFLDRLRAFNYVRLDGTQDMSSFFQLEFLNWWQQYSLGLAALFVLYWVYRLACRRRKPDDKSEIERINELYRGLNSEDSMLQQKLEKHLNWIILLKQAQTLAYVGCAGMVLWCYRQPSVIM